MPCPPLSELAKLRSIEFKYKKPEQRECCKRCDEVVHTKYEGNDGQQPTYSYRCSLIKREVSPNGVCERYFNAVDNAKLAGKKSRND